jgi:2'-5' RNA ligase
VAVAGTDFSDGCMLALYPPPDLAAALAVEGGLPVEELHITVAYCGDAVDIDPDVLLAAARNLTGRQAIAGSISGSARFTGGPTDVAVALIDSPNLETLRADALSTLAAAGIAVPRDHGFTAHCILQYLAPDAAMPVDRVAATPVRFEALSVIHGTTRTDLPLAHPIEAFAREAFAAGWASTGGPLTNRVHTACAIAVDLAAEHAEDPGILEATLDLGRLEGMWAQLFQRREDLIKQYTASVTAAWRNLIRPRLFRDGLLNLRAELGLTEAEADPKASKTAATAAAVAILAALPLTPGWAALEQSIRDALAAGRAEGIVSAVAIAAHQAKRDGLDWGKGFASAYQQLGRLDALWTDAALWQQRLLQRATDDLAALLAAKAAAGAGFDDMLDGASELLDSDEVEACDFTTDWAMTSAMGAGALALYQLQGALVLYWITAGDGLVCASCQDNEDNSPFALDAAPSCPDHPRCRCQTSADLDLSSFAAWFTT